MPTKVTVMNNGPIRIEGDFEILDPAGAAFGLAGRTVISLCRCGQSANKPFCDGSHARTGLHFRPWLPGAIEKRYSRFGFWA